LINKRNKHYTPVLASLLIVSGSPNPVTYLEPGNTAGFYKCCSISVEQNLKIDVNMVLFLNTCDYEHFLRCIFKYYFRFWTSQSRPNIWHL